MILFLMILAIPILSFSTCIIILRGDNYICVATDSKRTMTDPYTGKLMGTQQIEKVHAVGMIYFAVSGHDDAALTKYATLAITTTKDPIKAAKYFSDLMIAHYNDLMRLEQSLPKSDYQYYLHNALGGVTFFGFRNEKPYMYMVELIMKEIDGHPSVSATRDNDTPFMILGYRDHIQALSDIEFKAILKKSPSNPLPACVELVQLEISKHPDDIGCPIITLFLDSKQPHWGKAVCH